MVVVGAEKIKIGGRISIRRRYLGGDELAPAVIQVVSLEDGDLYAQRTGHNKVRLVPEASEIFSRKGVEGRYLFVRDDRGKVNSMIDRRNNEDVVGKKSGSDAT